MKGLFFYRHWIIDSYEIRSIQWMFEFKIYEVFVQFYTLQFTFLGFLTNFIQEVRHKNFSSLD